MSAPEIPNLLSLRGGPRLRGTRGRGRGGGGHFPSINALQQKDLAIQSTDSDAAVSRLSAVSLGYLDDPYAELFVNGPGARRMPVINRGTYARTTALEILIDVFLSSPSPSQTKQIISLGAGTDTRYFRLRARQKHHALIYHEFDFPDVSNLKYATVFKRPELSRQGTDGDLLFRDNPTAEKGDVEWGFTRGEETGYCFHPIDLRQLPEKSLDSFRGVRKDVPTLLISECCLCYLETPTASAVVNAFAKHIPSTGIVLYEPIGGNDAFGQTMVTNLAARNISMPTVREYKDLGDQRRRMGELGFEGGAEAESINTIWNDWIPAEEKQRVDRLEGLDEVEEWQVIARHYAVVWGWKGEDWDGWRKSPWLKRNDEIDEL